MIFLQIRTSEKRRNVAYIIGDDQTRDVVIVDAGFKPQLLLDRIRRLDASVKYILATHGHRDHIGAAPAIQEATDAKIAAFRTVPGIDIPLDDGDRLQVGRIPIEVLHTPGHSTDSVCFLVAGSKLLTGDTLYVGRTSKPGPGLARQFFESLHQRVMSLADDTEVWPGHAVTGTRSSSTIGRERQHNDVLKMNFADFAYNRRWDKKSKTWILPAMDAEIC